MKCVSIVIPVYNLEKYLEKCLESVINQTYRNLEIILLDDGSEDQSLKICRDFEAKDKRIKVFSHSNRGVSYTRNRGIKIAIGDYLMFVDGDDYLEPLWVENYVKAAEESNADIVIGGLTFLTEDGERYEKKSIVSGLFGKEIWNLICTEDTGVFGYVANKMYRADLLKKNTLFFNEEMYAQEDFDFAISAYAVCDRFLIIDEVGYIYRYVPEKRKHPLLQYIQNQLKLLKVAKEQSKLKAESESEVRNRIIKLVYIYLYYLPINDLFVSECEKLKKQVGLEDCINKFSGKGEAWIICQMLLYRKYNLLKKYFSIRHTLRLFIKRMSK